MGLKTFENLLHLRRARRWSADRVAASQLRLIRRVVATAAREVPLYREVYADFGDPTGIVSDWASFGRLPLVSKSQVKANFPDRIVSERVRPGDLYQVATSGTTDRVMLFHDEQKRDWDRAADFLMMFQDGRYHPKKLNVLIPSDACYERCGADEHGRVETVWTRLNEFVHAGRGRYKQTARRVLSQVMQDYVWRLRILKAIGVDGTATEAGALDEYLDSLRAWRPNVLSGLPMYLYLLAVHCERTRAESNGSVRRLTRRIRPAGGKLTPEMMRVVERAFGAGVRENFGTAELGTMAFDCPYSREQHLLSELFHVEFVRGGRPVQAGELGEMIVTDLRNHVSPLIRYRVGDVGRYFTGTCRCGFDGPRFAVDGTMGELVVTDEGRAVAGHEVVDFFLRQPDIDFVKVTQQSPSRFLAEIVQPQGVKAVPAADELSSTFSAYLGSTVTVQPRRVRRIAPERNGKYRLVHSVTHERFHTESESASEMRQRSSAVSIGGSVASDPVSVH